jgi:hypothetical protein
MHSNFSHQLVETALEVEYFRLGFLKVSPDAEMHKVVEDVHDGFDEETQSSRLMQILYLQLHDLPDQDVVQQIQENFAEVGLLPGRVFIEELLFRGV